MSRGFLQIKKRRISHGDRDSGVRWFLVFIHPIYSGRGKFMPLPLKSKILETPGFLVTDYIKMFPL
jgi:hypothetical protein